MPHLIAEQMCGRIHFCHHRTKSVTEKMIFEVDSQLLLDFPRRILEGIDGLDFPIGQASRGSAGEYQADERAGVAGLS